MPSLKSIAKKPTLKYFESKEKFKYIFLYNQFIFTNLTPHLCHLTNTFMEKKLYFLLTPHNIYQKQKTESVYLILKNN